MTKKYLFRLILTFLTLNYGLIAVQELRLAHALSQVQFIYDLTRLANFLDSHFSLRLIANVLDGYSYPQAIVNSIRLSDALMFISLWMLYSIALSAFKHKMSVLLIVLNLFKFFGMIQILILALSSSSPNYALFLMHTMAYAIMTLYGIISILILSLWIVEYKH